MSKRSRANEAGHAARQAKRQAAQIERLENRRLLAAHVWSGANSLEWSDPGNWSSGGVPSAVESNVTLDFPTFQPLHFTDNDIPGLTIDSITAENLYFVTGQAFTLDGSISMIGNGEMEIGNDITLSNDVSFSADLGRSLDLDGAISGTGNVTIEGPGQVYYGSSTPNTYVGSTLVDSGTLALDGATSSVPGNLEVAGGALADIQGSEQVDDSANIVVDTSGELTLDNGSTETVASFTGAGALDGDGTLVDATTGSDTFSGQINGSASLTMSQNGRITLSGAIASNTTGTVTADNGLLIINTDLSSATVDMEGGELAGGGTIGTLLNNDGTIQAGSFNPGTLNVAGDATLNANSWFDFIAADDTNYTGLAVDGNVTLTGNFDIHMLGVGYTPLTGKVFTVIDNSGGQPVSGTFTGDAEGQVLTFQSADWKLSYAGGTSGQDVTLTYLGLPTTTTGSAAASPTPLGQAVLHATVAHANGSAVPTGSVTFKEGSTVIGSANLNGSGVATLDAAALSLSTHTITAIYGGDSVYEASTIGTPITETIVLVPTTITLIESNDEVDAGSNVSFVATVLPVTATGTVTFSENGTTLGTDTITGSGRAALDISTLSGGTHHVIATYSGDATDGGSVSVTPATVNVVPSLSIGNVTVTAGAGGVADAAFTVTLNAASTDAVTVDYATADGTAKAGTDYAAASGTLTFAPGQTSKTIDVTVSAVTLFKPTEAFTLHLSNASHAKLATGGNTATATILNGNDGMPQAGLMVDPLDPTKTDFVVIGSAGNDNIQIKATKVPGQVLIKVNKTTLGAVSPTGYVIVYGGTGNDHIVADAKVTNNLMLFGGAGNDVLTGGAGNDVLVGGDGNDTLNAGTGMNIQIGGVGVEHLKGSRAGDVLIGASTRYDAGRFSDLYALGTLLNEWTSSSDSYSARVADMTQGVGQLDAAFDDTTVQTDTAVDHLAGTAGTDWLIPANTKTRLRMAREVSSRKVA
jgi:Ca2+-binding RTX toxin-like protein